jgi:hypothetical protein
LDIVDFEKGKKCGELKNNAAVEGSCILLSLVHIMVKNISNFNNTSDYLPLFNAVLITDLFVIFLSNTKIIDSKVLREWYAKYNLSAVIADVFIILIALIITRAIYYYVFDRFSIVNFIILAVVVQVIHDLLFSLFFSIVPRGFSKMLDTFKDYAKEASYKAILSDSGMMILSCLLASYLVNQSANTNMITFVVIVYLLPYFLYN